MSQNKYTKEFKMQVVQEYLNGVGSCTFIANKYGIGRQLVNHWVRFYQVHGEKYFDPKQERFTGKFKLKVVKYVLETGTSYTQAAHKFSVRAPSSIGTWVKIFLEYGEAELVNENNLTRRNRRKLRIKKQFIKDRTKRELIDEINRLQAENAYLKKLQTLILNQD
ncbi:transposase [Culicoidibacter larvae]|uniref:Transposase n=2 Tax=Culicoidibacter larvae TaxID=2579976 RepID=A0A5R8Q6G7_9FIRM|nr:transposase [Culicoidibacter larvae]